MILKVNMRHYFIDGCQNPVEQPNNQRTYSIWVKTGMNKITRGHTTYELRLEFNMSTAGAEAYSWLLKKLGKDNLRAPTIILKGF